MAGIKLAKLPDRTPVMFAFALLHHQSAIRTNENGCHDAVEVLGLQFSREAVGQGDFGADAVKHSHCGSIVRRPRRSYLLHRLN
ncbi:MAG: hypothetical protein QM688_01200 [Sphingomonas bacterium]